MDTKSNKKTMIYSLIAIMGLLIITIGATYAYFASRVDVSANFNVLSQTPGETYTFTASVSKDIYHNVTSEMMQESKVSNEAVASDDATLIVFLATPNNTEGVRCTYDIVWTWKSDDVYLASDMTLTDEYPYEYSIKVDTDSETDLSNITNTNGKLILSKETISSSSTTGTTKTHKIVSNVYNLPVHQTNIYDKLFQASVSVENVKCEITEVQSGVDTSLDVNVSSENGTEYTGSGQTIITASWTEDNVTEYCITNTSDSSSCIWKSTTGNTLEEEYTAPNEGENTVYVFIKDDVGNISTPIEQIIIKDSVAPVVSSVSDAGDGKISVTAEDEVSGIESYCVNQKATDTTDCTWTSISTTVESGASTLLATAMVTRLSNTFTTNAVATDGIYYVHLKDKAGNISHSPAVVVDQTSPAVSATYTSGGIVSVSVTENGSNISSYCVNQSASSTTDCTWIGVSTNTFSTTAITPDGVYYVHVKDNSNNVGHSSSVIVDQTDPVVSASYSSGGVISVSVTEDGSGVKEYCVNQNASSTEACTWTGVSINTFSTTALSVDGTYYVHVKDIANNIGHSSAVSVDVSAPVIDTLTDAGKGVISVSVTESGSGIKEYCVNTVNNSSSCSWVKKSTNSFQTSAVSNSGLYYVFVKDNANNISASKSINITIDSTPPSVTSMTQSVGVISVTTNEVATSYCVNQNATNTSDCSWTNVNSNSFNTSAITSEATYYVHVKDAAGNIGHSSSIAIDLTAPVVTAPTGYYCSYDTHTITVVENGSGIDSYCAIKSATDTSNCTWISHTSSTISTVLKVVSEGYPYSSIYIHVKDKAGNIGHSSGDFYNSSSCN